MPKHVTPASSPRKSFSGSPLAKTAISGDAQMPELRITPPAALRVATTDEPHGSSASGSAALTSPAATALAGTGRWSAAEDTVLRQAVSVVGAKNWRRISGEYFRGIRTDVQCLHRWQKVLRPGLVKGAWSEEEDKTIIDQITAGVTKWSEIAERIPGRIGKQCRERWFNHLDPCIKKEAWTNEEDETLLRMQAELGNAWCRIAKALPGRPENAVKNRWNSAVRRRRQAELGMRGAGFSSTPAATSGSAKTPGNATAAKVPTPPTKGKTPRSAPAKRKRAPAFSSATSASAKPAASATSASATSASALNVRAASSADAATTHAAAIACASSLSEAAAETAALAAAELMVGLGGREGVAAKRARTDDAYDTAATQGMCAPGNTPLDMIARASVLAAQFDLVPSHDDADMAAALSLCSVLASSGAEASECAAAPLPRYMPASSPRSP